MHRCTRGGGGEGVWNSNLPPRQIFEKLVNKNAIKPQIGGLPWLFFLKALTPPRDFLAKTSRTPLDFQPVCIYELMSLHRIPIGVVSTVLTDGIIMGQLKVRSCSKNLDYDETSTNAPSNLIGRAFVKRFEREKSFLWLGCSLNFSFDQRSVELKIILI